MTLKDKYINFTEEFIDMESILLTLMFITSSYMVWETFDFSSTSAARFPRLTAGVVVIGSALLLARGYLPDRIASALTQESEVFEADEDITERQEEATRRTQTETGDDGSTDISIVDRPVHDSFFTALVTIGYGLLAYTIGIFLATPIFIVVYARWFKLSWVTTAGLTVFSVVLAYAFFSVIGVPLDRGELVFTNGILGIIRFPLGGLL